MKAIANREYGSPDKLQLVDNDIPTVGPGAVLVRVRAASVNPADWHFMRGSPYIIRVVAGLRRPKQTVRGLDVAGEVEAVGENVTGFRPHDAVFGSCQGAFAEYTCGEAGKFAPKPANLTFEQGAAVPIAGVTALQALAGRVQSGQRALINGAAGGVGTFAVQIAKAFGATVTGVCSGRNLDFVRSIGADDAVDYTLVDFTRNGQRYDLLVDAVGNRSLSDLRRSTTPKGTIVLVGAGGGKVLGPLLSLPGTLLMSLFMRQRLASVIAKVNREDLEVLKELIEGGKVTPVIDRTYPLNEAADAIRYLEAGHARGKVVLTV